MFSQLNLYITTSRPPMWSASGCVPMTYLRLEIPWSLRYFCTLVPLSLSPASISIASPLQMISDASPCPTSIKCTCSDALSGTSTGADSVLSLAEATVSVLLSTSSGLSLVQDSFVIRMLSSITPLFIVLLSISLVTVISDSILEVCLGETDSDLSQPVNDITIIIRRNRCSILFL